MKKIFLIGVLAFFSAAGFAQGQEDKDGWISLWDGETFDGWKANENAESFSIEDGVIKVDGPRAHLFYVGPVMDHNFKNFEFKAKVMTEPGANSGIFFHTKFQEDGWPVKGYEAQVNQSHSDWRKTGSLYSFDDVREVHVEDNEWFTEHIIVREDKIIIKINGKTVVEYIESADNNRSIDAGGKKIDS